jgi:DNA-directed RNA polymerase subunit beta
MPKLTATSLLVPARRGEKFFEVPPEDIDMIGITPQGFLSVGSALIPFLEHDDTGRALMGGGMMRQTLPLIKPERPRVGTGMERIVGRSSGHSLAAKRAGTVTSVTGKEIVITQPSGEKRYYVRQSKSVSKSKPVKSSLTVLVSTKVNWRSDAICS